MVLVPSSQVLSKFTSTKFSIGHCSDFTVICVHTHTHTMHTIRIVGRVYNRHRFIDFSETFDNSTVPKFKVHVHMYMQIYYSCTGTSTQVLLILIQLTPKSAPKSGSAVRSTKFSIRIGEVNLLVGPSAVLLQYMYRYSCTSTQQRECPGSKTIIRFLNIIV